MSKRIEDYMSRQEIYDLCCRYMRGLDRLDRELLMSLFHEDAWCEYGFMDGEPAAFVDYAMNALAGHAANHHMIGNVLIDLQGDEAFGEVYFNAYHKVPGPSGFDDVVIAGRYLDRYERRAGVWKFAYRSEIVDFSRTQPTSDSYFEIASDCLRGARRDDAVYDLARRRRPRSPD